MPGMKGKWAQGIEPRNFAWVVKEKLAVCERPGGYGANHRRVRRQEEIIWIREQGFTCVVSLIPSPHNLHNYDELGVTWRHRPFAPHDDAEKFVAGFFPELPRDAGRGPEGAAAPRRAGRPGLRAGRRVPAVVWHGRARAPRHLDHRATGPSPVGAAGTRARHHRAGTPQPA